MRIKKIAIKNFKRFTDLTITDLSEDAKLVLIIGSNGSGKSSLFDAFDYLTKGNSKGLPFNHTEAEIYYKKDKELSTDIKIELFSGDIIEKKDDTLIQGANIASGFLGRSSIRIVPRISNNANPSNIAKDQDSPPTYIDNDTRFVNDVFLYIQQINNALREPIFSGKQADTLKIFRDFIEPLNTSLLNIFGGDEATTIQIAEFKDATPNTTAQLIFKKGLSKINYDLLSHGEKQVVILLINFIVRQEYYQNAVIFIDEMDCHLNTALQSNLLHEIVTQWIPDNSQLWTASHALGFIEYAKKSGIADTIDLDLFNFDHKQNSVPLPKDNLDVYEVAIPKTMIASILSDFKIVVVENKNDEFYNAILGEKKYIFVPANNNIDVFLSVKGDKHKLGIRDRDYLRDDEVAVLREQYPNLKILPYYTFENLLYHPANIEELGLNDFNLSGYVAEITRQKNEKLIDIIAEIGTSRARYIEYKEPQINNDGNLKPITNALSSNDFEQFYPYFNAKKYLNRSCLASYNLTTLQLVSTHWFKSMILQTIEA